MPVLPHFWKLSHRFSLPVGDFTSIWLKELMSDNMRPLKSTPLTSSFAHRVTHSLQKKMCFLCCHLCYLFLPPLGLPFLSFLPSLSSLFLLSFSPEDQIQSLHTELHPHPQATLFIYLVFWDTNYQHWTQTCNPPASQSAESIVIVNTLDRNPIFFTSK